MLIFYHHHRAFGNKVRPNKTRAKAGVPNIQSIKTIAVALLSGALNSKAIIIMLVTNRSTL